jgi:hypothetical protein
MSRGISLTVVCLIGWAALVAAQGTNCGEFLVSSTSPGVPRDPAVASAPNGDFVVVWKTTGYPGGIFGRLFDASGAPRGPGFLIGSPLGSDPAVAMDAAGNFVVVWTRSDLYGRRFDASGVPLGPEFVVPTFSALNVRPAVAANPAGDFVVTWTNIRTPAWSVQGRSFDAAGAPVGKGFLVHPDDTSQQDHSSVTFQGTGTFVVVWENFHSSTDVRGRRIDASGVPLGDAFQVSDTAAVPTYPHVAAGPGGDFVVAWPRDVPSGRTIAGRVFDATGNPRGPAFQVSTALGSVEWSASVAGDPVHGYEVAWQDQVTDGIVAQRLDPAAVPSGPNFSLGATPAVDPSRPAVAPGADGRYVTVWESSSGIVGRLDCPARFYAVPPCRIADTREPPGTPLFANVARQFPVTGSCGISPDARAVALNITAIEPTDLGNLRVHPGRTSAPLASVVNFVPGRTRAGHAIVPVGTNGHVTVQCDMPTGSTGATHLVLDVYGYFGG